jgi:DNA repair photolyase
VLMGPIVPFLSDSPAQLDAAVRQIAASGAAHVMPIVLHLRPGAREWFLGWLGEAHPDLVPRYAELYGRGAYARKDYRERIGAQVRDLAERYGVGRRGSGVRGAVQRGDGRTGRGGVPPAGLAAQRGAVAHEQLTLL